MSTSSVSDKTVDPPLFRLCEFATAWLRPLLKNVPRESLDAHAWPAELQDRLSLALAVEAASWIRLGQQIGYFAEAPTHLGRDLAQLRDAAINYDLQGWFLIDMPDTRPSEFARSLAVARESLSPERWRFICLMFFASEDEFASSLGEVQEVADALRDRPWLTLPPRGVNRIAWSLEDPGSISPRRRHPASWRTSFDEPIWKSRVQSGGEPPEHRWERLSGPRSAIVSAVEWKIDYDDTPVELRISEARRPPLGDPEETRWPPPWAQGWE